jgi:hypothetical protein
MSTPLFQSPDEIQHVYRAASAARGELLIRTHGPAAPNSDLVSVPHQIADLGRQAACFAFHPSVPASCAEDAAARPALVRVGTGAARYNPVYYALVGAPTLLNTGRPGLYGMRLAADLICAALLAAAMLGALQWGRSLAAVGLLLGLTPTAAYLAGMVNPNGLEVAAAAAVWTNLLVWLMRPAYARQALVRVAIAAVAMLVSRSISPLWLLAIACCTIPLINLHWLRSELRSRRSAVVATTLASVGVLSVAWIAVSHELQIAAPHTQNVPLRGTSFGTRFAETGLHVHDWVRQGVAFFGWLDTSLPPHSYHLWELTVLALAVLAVLCRQYRLVAVAAITAVIALYLSRVLEAQQLGVIGRFWQGRYTLPLAIGVPIVLGAAVRAWRRRLTGAVWLLGVGTCLVVTGLYLQSMLLFLHRNIAGVQTPFSLSGPWQPPLGPLPWLVIMVMSMALLSWVALAPLLGTDTAALDGNEGPPTEQAFATASH